MPSLIYNPSDLPSIVFNKEDSMRRSITDGIGSGGEISSKPVVVSIDLVSRCLTIITTASP
jgi:hypothetical protein